MHAGGKSSLSLSQLHRQHVVAVLITALKQRYLLEFILWGRAERRRHGVVGGAPVNFGRRQRRADGQKIRRLGRPKEFVPKIPDKSLFYPLNFLIIFLVTIENCNKITTQQQWHWRRPDKLSAAAAGGAPINKSRRRRP